MSNTRPSYLVLAILALWAASVATVSVFYIAFGADGSLARGPGLVHPNQPWYHGLVESIPAMLFVILTISTCASFAAGSVLWNGEPGARKLAMAIQVTNVLASTMQTILWPRFGSETIQYGELLFLLCGNILSAIFIWVVLTRPRAEAFFQANASPPEVPTPLSRMA